MTIYFIVWILFYFIFFRRLSSTMSHQCRHLLLTDGSHCRHLLLQECEAHLQKAHQAQNRVQVWTHCMLTHCGSAVRGPFKVKSNGRRQDCDLVGHRGEGGRRAGWGEAEMEPAAFHTCSSRWIRSREKNWFPFLQCKLKFRFCKNLFITACCFLLKT